MFIQSSACAIIRGSQFAMLSNNVWKPILFRRCGTRNGDDKVALATRIHLLQSLLLHKSAPFRTIEQVAVLAGVVRMRAIEGIDYFLVPKIVPIEVQRGDIH